MILCALAENRFRPEEALKSEMKAKVFDTSLHIDF